MWIFNQPNDRMKPSAKKNLRGLKDIVQYRNRAQVFAKQGAFSVSISLHNATSKQTIFN